MERLEEAAARLGRGELNLGVGAGPSEVRGFYAHLGYSGRSRMRKGLPLSPLRRSG
jgi:hypothetical protein